MIAKGTLRFVLVPWILLIAAGCGGSPVSVPSSPEGTAEAVCLGLANCQPGVLWAAMPASYQKDVNEIITLFASKMDAEIYDKSIALLSKSLRILKDKRDFILANPMFAMMVQDKKSEVEESWGAVVDLFATLVDSDLKTLDSLKKMDAGEFLNTTGARMMKRMSDISSSMPGDEFNKEFLAKLRQVKIEKVSHEGSKAALKVTMPAGISAMSPLPVPEVVELEQVEGKWIPGFIAKDWARNAAEMKGELQKLTAEDMAKDKPEIMGMLAMFEGMLDQLDGAENAEQFNQILMGLMEGF